MQFVSRNESWCRQVRWGTLLISCTYLLTEKIYFLKLQILTPQDSLVVPTYNYNVPRHLQPLGHTTQPVQERGGKCKKDLRGGRWAAPKPSNKPLHNSLLQVLELLSHYLQNSSRISSVLCFMLESDFRKAKVRGLCSERKLKFGTILSPIFSTHFYRRRQNVQLTSSHCKTQINIHRTSFDEIWREQWQIPHVAVTE